uniref:DUF7866 domain-containing protein n=1 Tax=Leersia perrieri TaxID=77586 RepID=A0A0D9V9J2_9ORYZ
MCIASPKSQSRFRLSSKAPFSLHFTPASSSTFHQLASSSTTPQIQIPNFKAIANSQSNPQTLASPPAMPTPTFLFILLLLFLAATFSNCSATSPVGAEREEEVEMVPMMGAEAGGGGFSAMVLNETRRRLGSFQLCAPCTCCVRSRGECQLSPCCYAINCNIPNRPFGFCSFTPKSCDCLGCSL